MPYLPKQSSSSKSNNKSKGNTPKYHQEAQIKPKIGWNTDGGLDLRYKMTRDAVRRSKRTK